MDQQHRNASQSESEAYQLWCRRLWNGPFSGGFAGFLLMAIALASTLCWVGFMVIAYASFGLNTHAAKGLSYLAPFFGIASYLLWRPVLWRMTPESRRWRDLDRRTPD
jgi:hypothetical protein